MTTNAEKQWKNVIESGKRKLTRAPVNGCDILRNDFMRDFLKYDFFDCGQFRNDCNVLIARNKHKLTFVTAFFEQSAQYGCIFLSNERVDITPTFERICTELEGVQDLSLGPMSLKDGGLKFSNKKDTQVLVLELTAFSMELRMYFDQTLPNPQHLTEVINSDVLERESGKGFLSKIGLISGKKAELKKGSDPLDEFEIINIPPLDLNNFLLNQKGEVFNRELVQDISERDANFLSKFDDVEPFLMPFHVSRLLEQSTEDFKFQSSKTLVAELRSFFPEEDMQDSLVQEALEKCNYIPEAAANWILEKRKDSVELLCSKFPNFSQARAMVIGEKCKYDKNMMLVLANVDIMNMVKKIDIVPNLQDFLTDPTVNEESRIDTATLELFGDAPISKYDANIRARKLIEMLSFEEEINRPAGEGWWDNYENFSFDDLVSFMSDVPDPSVPDLFKSRILNNQCDICTEYYHKNKIIEFECGCQSCVGCVLVRLKLANDGRNLEEAMLCPNSNCPQNDMSEDDKRNAFNLRYQQMCTFGEQFPEHKEVFDQFVESYNRHAALLLENFTLCSHPPCQNGQVQGDPTNNCMVCHECKQKTCYSCKNQWYDDHKTMSCQEYGIWLRKHHPEIAGISGDSDPFEFITCPECQSIFHMQRGGCIHFVCKNCKSDFCGFCSRIFYNKERPCIECEPVKQNSLHAHHPRNCFYYLRDESVEWLIQLLERFTVNWKEELPKLESEDGQCPVIVIKDDEDKEHPCGEAAHKDGFTFCEKHFKEFLSIIIYENKKVDPIFMLDLNYLKVICGRENIEIPPNATAEILRDNITQQSPLDDDAGP